MNSNVSCIAFSLITNCCHVVVPGRKIPIGVLNSMYPIHFVMFSRRDSLHSGILTVNAGALRRSFFNASGRCSVLQNSGIAFTALSSRFRSIWKLSTHFGTSLCRPGSITTVPTASLPLTSTVFPAGSRAPCSKPLHPCCRGWIVRRSPGTHLSFRTMPRS
jgi:hypothetical protein